MPAAVESSLRSRHYRPKSGGLTAYGICVCLAWLMALSGQATAAKHLEDSAAPRQAADSQSANELGLPLMRRYAPRDYRAQPMNWGVAQDARGLVYLGNADGVLEFDGQRWRLIRVDNDTVVRSLGADSRGRIYVGAVGEIGYLQPDQSGSTQYVSLLEKLPADARDFADVWDTLSTSTAIFFATDRKLFRIRGEQVTVWKGEPQFHGLFHVGQRVFVRQPGRGLLELIDDQLQLLPQGETFADERIYAMLPAPSTPASADEILIGTRTQGFLLLTETGLRPWPTEIDAELKRDLLYDGLLTSKGQLALGTLQGGVYLLDAQGRLRLQLDKANGLPDSGIIALFEDREGGMWITTDNGVARVELDGAVTRFDDRNGLVGTSFAVYRHLDRLFVGTAQGLYWLRPGPNAKFQRIEGIDGQTWGLQSLESTLLVANYQGVYAVEGEQATLIRGVDPAYAISRSRSDPSRVFVGLRTGLASMRQVDGTWQDEGQLPGIRDEIRTMFEDVSGWLWLGSYSSGVLRVRLPAASTEAVLEIERFGEAAGLPSLNNNWVYPIADEPRFTTLDGIYRFDSANKTFHRDAEFSGLFSGPRQISSLHDDPDRGVWLFAKDHKQGLERAGLAAQLPGAGYRWQSRTLGAVEGAKTEGMQRIERDANAVIWFAGADGLHRFDPRVESNLDQPFACLLRRVASINGRLVYGGNGELPRPTLAYDENALRFEFSAASFAGSEPALFQVQLEGSDQGWSDWSSESYKDYNNLFEGSYRFRVRAKNAYDTISREAEFSFVVRPPWFRTTWAYLTYALAVALIGWLGLRWRLLQLRAQRDAQEAIVSERTRQIAALGEIGRAITAKLDLDVALETLYAQLNQLLDADAFGVGLYQPANNSLEFRLAIEDGQRRPPYVRSLNDKSPLAARCIEDRESILIRDYAATPTDPPLQSELECSSPTRSLMYVPMLLKGTATGLIVVRSKKADAFDNNDLSVLKTLAAYAVTAIENARVLSELTRSHESLIVAQQQLVLQEKMASLGQLVAGVAHEVNTPLGVALTACTHLEASTRTIESDMQRGALTRSAFNSYVSLAREGSEMISRNLERAANLVHSFKQISVDRSSDGHRQFYVHEFLQDLIRSLGSLWKQRPIEVTFDCPVELEMDGFPGALGQVLTILIQNALLHAFDEQQAGAIRIDVSGTDAGWITICCTDNGRGIAPDLRGKIFEPFFTTKRNQGGTGLGLHIAFNLITQKLGGKIEVESKLGEGSCFRIHLPVVAPS